MSMHKVLTGGGFVRIPLDIPDRNGDKIRLYCLEDLALEKIQQAQEALLKEQEKHRTYQGKLQEFQEDIQEKRYLLKEGRTLCLIKGSFERTSAGLTHNLFDLSQQICHFLKSVNVGGAFHVSGENAKVTINKVVIHVGQSAAQPKHSSVLLPSLSPLYHLPTLQEYQSRRLSKELEYAEGKYKEVQEAIQGYTEGRISIEVCTGKIESACGAYQEILEDYSDQEEIQRKLSERMDLLRWHWCTTLFSHARHQCIQSGLEEIALYRIDNCIDILDSDKRGVEFLREWNRHNRWLADTWPQVKQQLQVSNSIEARLFAYAILSELLDKQQEAVQGYFRLAEYHIVAGNQNEAFDRSLLMQSCLKTARSLETPLERQTKGTLIHHAFVQVLKAIRSQSTHRPFSCFISYDVTEKTERWISDFLYRDLITLNICPIFRSLSQKVGQSEVDYAKQMRESPVTLVLCNPEMKEKYENYLRGICSDYRLGIEMKFLQDRYLSGKDLENTFHLQLGGEWSAIAFSDLPDFFERKNLINFCEKKGTYTSYLPYFENAIALFCTILGIPGNIKGDLFNQFSKRVAEITNSPLTTEKKQIAQQFVETRTQLPIPPEISTSPHSHVQLIGVPSIGKDFQPRMHFNLHSFFQDTSFRVLSQDPSLICGTGKTYCAAQYVHQYGDRYGYALWIEAKDKEAIEGSLKRIIDKIGEQNQGVRDIPSFLKWVQSAPGVLLIYDHVPHPEFLNPYLPSGPIKGHILVTSRHPTWPSLWEVTRLSLLTPEEGKNLLMKITGKPQEEASRQLALSLGNIPSLISRAGYLLKQTNESPSLYPTIIESENASKRRILTQRSNLSRAPEHFVGRKTQLAAIQETFFSTSSSLLILQGAACVGKTALAHQCACENVFDFKLIWHLPFSCPERLRESLYALAKRLQIPQEQNLEALMQKIYQEVKKLGEKTLLILDDFSPVHRVFLPPSIPALHILVTTEETHWDLPQAHLLPIPPLDKAEAFALVRHYVDELSARTLSDRLDLFMGNPLALLIAASSIKEARLDPKAYLQALERSIGNTLTHEKLLLALWEEIETFCQATRLVGAAKASPVVKLCACSPGYAISKKKLEDWFQKALQDQNLDLEEDPIPIVLRDLLTLLRKFSILDIEGDTVALSPLLARAIKRKMTEEERNLYANILV